MKKSKGIKPFYNANMGLVALCNYYGSYGHNCAMCTYERNAGVVFDTVASKYSKIMTQAKSVLERYMTKLQIIHSNEIMVVKHAKNIL